MADPGFSTGNENEMKKWTERGSTHPWTPPPPDPPGDLRKCSGVQSTDFFYQWRHSVISSYVSVLWTLLTSRRYIFRLLYAGMIHEAWAYRFMEWMTVLELCFFMVSLSFFGVFCYFTGEAMTHSIWGKFCLLNIFFLRFINFVFWKCLRSFEVHLDYFTLVGSPGQTYANGKAKWCHWSKLDGKSLNSFKNYSTFELFINRPAPISGWQPRI